VTSFLQAQEQTGSRGAPPREYLTAARRVTVAEMLALDASPIVLVPAPGPGKVIVPTSAIARGEGGTPYNQGAGNLAIRFEDPGLGGAFMVIDSIAGADAPFVKFIPSNAGIADLFEDQAVVLATDLPGGGELTEGDYEIEIRLEYQIVEL